LKFDFNGLEVSSEQKQAWHDSFSGCGCGITGLHQAVLTFWYFFVKKKVHIMLYFYKGWGFLADTN